ncbi:MAG: TonB-dependent receptor [Bacteroidia bacterium]|nr:TonB-dependent receptor [Bacteroidia bacterium]
MRNLALQLLLWIVPQALWSQVNITGTITQKSSGEPLLHAEIAIVELDKLSTVNQAGVFRIEGIYPGTYTLRVSAPLFLTSVQSITVGQQPLKLDFKLIRSISVTDEVLITATRASEKTATTYSVIDKAEIRKQNFGQDMPFLLNQLPSTVVNSDAGAGIGYTGIRIRGSDPTRTNVTLNGIPLNDAEAHGVFWVDLPDFASSVENIQVQRGVGTSTNGAAAFGASINIQTSSLSYEPYADFSNSLGSFNTMKNTLRAGTGLIKDRFSLDARLSSIQSDGWIDRGFSDLKSWFVSGSFYGKKSLLKLNVFSGKEQTYQAWWGVPESYLNDPQLRRSNYYTYENETDNFIQDHYQLHYSFEPVNNLSLNLSLHYTGGKGYYEQYREDESLSAYGVNDLFLIHAGDTVTTTDLIRRRWLDNDFYGFTWSANYTPRTNIRLTAGGSWNQYDGYHFGEVIWAQYAGDLKIRDRYYNSRGFKTDFNTYAKATIDLTSSLVLYADMQVRQIDYSYGDSTLTGAGIDNDGREIQGAANYIFFNPKAGITWQLNEQSDLYASFNVGNREPVRGDFIDAPQGRTPLPETLHNLEAGYRLKRKNFSLHANYFLMDYTNQLVLNGELNDVGASIRQNVTDSYRTGIELVVTARLLPVLNLSANMTLSRNKIKSYEEYLYNYDPFEIETLVYENTDISFSPNLISGGILSYTPWKGLEISALSKYVGKQYLDNTNNDSRVLDAFWVNDLRINWTFYPSFAKEIQLGLLINNILNEQYEPNGYTFSYKLGADTFTENYYYPQAGTNFLASLSLRF